MNKYIQYAVLVLFVGLFASCDYAKYPIDIKPVTKIDARLLGKWKVKKEKEEYMVSRDGKSADPDYRYLILAKDKTTGKIEKHTAYLSDVGGAKFLNVFVKDDSTEGYIFIRILDISASGNKATVASVADTTLKYITRPEEIRERITRRLNDPSFYGDTAYFYKIK